MAVSHRIVAVSQEEVVVVVVVGGWVGGWVVWGKSDSVQAHNVCEGEKIPVVLIDKPPDQAGRAIWPKGDMHAGNQHLLLARKGDPPCLAA